MWSDRPPLPRRRAFVAVAKSVVRTVSLLRCGAIEQPRVRVGEVLTFSDGSRAPIYRETIVRSAATPDPAVLVVWFRLRWIRGRGHRAFRAESRFNTPMFVGFPGFVSKLWLANDEQGVYRGIYQWNDASLADAYARALWRVLELVCVRGSIHYVVLPGVSRDDVLARDVIGRLAVPWAPPLSSRSSVS